MGDIIAGVLLLGLGALICFAGLRVFFITLPIVGFFTGVYVGAAGVQAVFGGGFFSTVTAVIVGFVVGLLFALLSYLFWYVGVIIAAGSVGASIGSGLMAAFGINAGLIVFIVAALFAVIAVVAAVILSVPVYIVIVSTAFAGATTMVAGVLLVVNRIDLAQLSRGATWAIINASFWWLLVWAVFAGLGLAVQLRGMAEARLPEDRWEHLSVA